MSAITGDSSKNWMAIASLVIGILSFCGLGFTVIVPIIGLVLGFMGRSSAQGTMAVIGIILNALVVIGYLIFFFFFGGLAVLGAMMPTG
jgi:hypothetical protein